MTEAPSLQPFLADKQLQRGTALQMMVSTTGKNAVPILVEHVQPGYLVVSCTLEEKTKQHFLGAAVSVYLQTEQSATTIQCLVVQEQLIWPVCMLGLIPTGVTSENLSQTNDLLTPDYIINVPYKVMGARPIEEKGEGVLLKFSPDRLVIGTDGYVAKGDFIHLSFVLPRKNLEVVGMAKVVEKTFQESQAIMELVFTDINDKHQQLIKDYYNALSKTVS